MTKLTYKDANRRYRWLFLPTMGLYVAAVIGGPFLIKEYDTAIVRAIAGLAAGLPLIVVAWALMRFAGETDEFNQQISFKALAAAGATTMSAAAGVGFLQLYEAVPLFPAFWFVIFYFLAFGAAMALYTRGAGCAPDKP